jgi:hypothetical protein
MLLRELFEAPGKTAVLAFGRLNPPTIGHAKLVDAITAQEGDHYLFLSHTQKPKTDPLDFATKLKFAKQFFPGVNIGHQAVRTPVQALEQLQSLGYTDIIFIAGSDRVDGFQKLFDTYNGQPNKAGDIPFKFNSINVVSAGERDPDADDVSGMSASKMRAAAAAGDLNAFAQGVPDKKLAQTMYDAVRKGMGVKDTVAAEDASSEEEDEFHRKLDKLVHKTFGHSSDERKKKKTESDVVMSKGHLVSYLKTLIADYLDKEQDIDKLSRVLKMIIGKEIKTRGTRYQITSEDIMETIRQIKGGFRLYSKKGKNLGTFDTKAGAEKHEREIQYFKHKK